MTSIRQALLAALALCCLLLASRPLCAQAATPSFEGKAVEESANGSIALAWKLPSEEVPEGTQFELQHASSPNFEGARTLGPHPDTGTFLSGLADGSHHFRVRARTGSSDTWSAWSSPKELKVAHHPRGRALGFAAMGAVVFALTLGMILVGNARSKRPEEPS